MSEAAAFKPAHGGYPGTVPAPKRPRPPFQKPGNPGYVLDVRTMDYVYVFTANRVDVLFAKYLTEFPLDPPLILRQGPSPTHRGSARKGPP